MNRPSVALERRASRHNLDAIDGYVRETTTLIPADMYETVNDDLEAIRRGDGRKLPNHRYEYRGRIYAWEHGSTYYPVSGPGFIQASRGTYKALLAFKDHDGINAESLYQLANTPTIGLDEVESAIDIWQKRSHPGAKTLQVDEAKTMWRAMPTKPRIAKNR